MLSLSLPDLRVRRAQVTERCCRRPRACSGSALCLRPPQTQPLPLFQGLLMLLQNLPTIHWGNEEIGLLLAEAYRLKYMFADAPNHYRR